MEEMSPTLMTSDKVHENPFVDKRKIKKNVTNPKVGIRYKIIFGLT